VAISLLLIFNAVALGAFVALKTTAKPMANRTFLGFCLITPLVGTALLWLLRGWAALHVFSTLVLWGIIQFLPLAQPEITIIGAWLYLESIYGITYLTVRKIVEKYPITPKFVDANQNP